MMSKILLAAVNASFSHTNIAVRSISLYCENPEVSFGEWTINQMMFEVLREIREKNPQMVIFSVYIWNIDFIEKLVKNLKALDSSIIIGAGGPEVSFCAENVLENLPELDFVIQGEGEETVKEISQKFFENKTKTEFFESLKDVKGVFFRSCENKILFTKSRPLISDLSLLKFPYSEITEGDHKIFYYESSRGCPFSCAYCMSSLDKRVRFMPLERVKKDLQFFLDSKVKLVKFVDRTYNLDEKRYLEIWKYILDNHNGCTKFHFEIEAEFLSENAIDFLQNVPENVFQFEIGVQSVNPKTLSAVSRSPETEKLFHNVKRLPKTIPCHLDLIAGLPFENLESFGKSFDSVMNLAPDEMQLGFLKVLYGTQMKEFAEKNGFKFLKTAPYEVLSTPFLSFEEICFLKDLEVLLDVFYNSGNFKKSSIYAGRVYGFWKFFCEAVEMARIKNVFDSQRNLSFWFEFFADFAEFKKDSVLIELLRFDFVKSGKKGSFPSWYSHHYDKELHKKALDEHDGITNCRLNFAYSEYEEFSVNPLDSFPETTGKSRILFYYKNYKNKSDFSEERQILL